MTNQLHINYFALSIPLKQRFWAALVVLAHAHLNMPLK